MLLVTEVSGATGFARVGRALARQLGALTGVRILPLDGPAPGVGPQLEVGPRLAHDPWRVPEVVRYARSADGVLLVGSVEAMLQWGPALLGTPALAYMSVENRGQLRPARVGALQGLTLAVYTHYARHAVEQVGLMASVVPHGLDAAFRPPPPHRAAARRSLFPAVSNTGFWVLNAHRAHPRKRIDLVLEGFARFCRGKPDDVRLVLHMGSAKGGRSLVERLGLHDRVLLTSPEGRRRHLDDHSLRLLYGCCQVGTNGSTGEGFGLIALEHAACGGAQIMTSHTANAALWTDAASLLPAGSATLLSAGEPVVLDPADLAAALDRLYAAPQELRALQEAGRRRALEDRFDWGQIAGRLLSLLPRR